MLVTVMYPRDVTGACEMAPRRYSIAEVEYMSSTLFVEADGFSRAREDGKFDIG